MARLEFMTDGTSAEVISTPPNLHLVESTPPIENTSLTAEGLASKFARAEGSTRRLRAFLTGNIPQGEEVRTVVEDGIRYIVDPITGKKYPSIAGGVIGGPYLSPPEMVDIIIDAQKVPVQIPEDASEKIDLMRALLQKIEIEELDFEKDPVVARQVNEMYQVIIALTKDDYKAKHIGDPNQNIGEKLHNEFFQRLAFQKIVGAFGIAENEKEVKEAVKNISGDQLNLFFHDVPEFIFALTYYEMHGEDFGRTTDAAGNKLKDIHGNDLIVSQVQDNFRKAAKADLEAKIAAGGTTIGGEAVTLRADNLDWTINRAEKLWRLWGRRETQTYVRYDSKKDVYIFDDTDIKKGDDVYRKIFRLKEWVLSDREKDNLRVHRQLMKGIKDGDLWENDYVEEIISKSDAILAETRARDPAGIGVNITAAVVGGKLDYTQVCWRKLDFTKPWGGSDFDWWATKRVEAPTQAVMELIKPDGFWREPSEKSLESLLGKFAYQKADQYRTYLQLIENFVDFRLSKDAEKSGYIKFDRAQAESAIERLAAHFGLKPEEFKKALNDTITPDFMHKLLLYYDRFNMGSSFLLFLWELIKGTLAAGFSTK